MKKIFLVLFLGTMINNPLTAQVGTPRPIGARLQGLKIEFITKYLKLLPEEASFWSRYFDYTEEIKKARLETPDDVIATDEKILVIRKK